MRLFKNCFSLLLYYLLTVVGFIVVGTLGVALSEVFGGRGKSVLLFYTIYFVVAIFNAVFYVNLSSDKIVGITNAKVKALIICLLNFIFSAVLLKLFYRFEQMNTYSYTSLLDYTVPGQASITWMYFIVLFLATCFFCYLSLPTKKAESK
jgi:hypothetical protein